VGDTANLDYIPSILLNGNHGARSLEALIDPDISA
jgi:hypothetical protein